MYNKETVILKIKVVNNNGEILEQEKPFTTIEEARTYTREMFRKYPPLFIRKDNNNLERVIKKEEQ